MNFRIARWTVLAVLLAGCSTTAKSTSEPQLLGTPPKPSEDPFFYVARPPVEAVAETTGTIGDVEESPPPPGPSSVVEEPMQGDSRLQEQLTREIAARQALEAELALAVSRFEQAREQNAALERAQAEAAREASRASTSVTQAEESASSARQQVLVLTRELESAKELLKSTEASLLSARQALDAERARAKVPSPKPAQPQDAPAAATSTPSCHACVRICPEKGACPKDAELVCGWGTGRDKQAASQRARAECDGALQAMRQSGAYSRVSGQCPVAQCQ